ncbi:MAG: rRNA pseudouridine synthase [Nitrospinaceae bacterium]|jgi:23S rRNA pseudouridine2605 synthase|nr:MAG: rRNA pseudouridine synthase [Nitrospinaceae bacterium]
MKIRLQKIIAEAGLASRREAERWIAEGKVQVNGLVETRPGTLADPEVDRIKVRGRLVPPPGGKVVLAFNKPGNVLTTMVKDAKGRLTVGELLKKSPGRVFPVGRLDYHTQGLLLFTNDGALSKKLLDPESRVERVYQAKVRGVPSEKALSRLRKGVRLDQMPTLPVEVELKRLSGNNSFLELTLVEGKNRHVKRICEAVGHPVVKLKRVRFGSVSLGAIPLGAWRYLSPREIRALGDCVRQGEGALAVGG